MTNYVGDDENKDDKGENNEEASDPPWWSTQNNKTPHDEQLEEMLHELENGAKIEPTKITEVTNEAPNTPESDYESPHSEEEEEDEKNINTTDEENYDNKKRNAP